MISTSFGKSAALEKKFLKISLGLHLRVLVFDVSLGSVFHSTVVEVDRGTDR